MDHKVIYYLVLAATAAAAIWRGGHAEKWGVATALLASIASTVTGLDQSWRALLFDLLVIDLAVLASFWWLTFHSSRFWPYWVTGWQLVAVLVHAQRALFADILPEPYALMSMYLAYPMLILIMLASVRPERAARAID
jgi:hypothetical protein